MKAIDRAQFLRLGALGAGAGLVLGPTGIASAATFAPEGDDLATVHLGAVAELVSIELFRELRRSPELPGPLRARAAEVRDEKIRQLEVLNGILGEDAVSADDFVVALPQRELSTRQRLAALGVRIERVLVGSLLNGVPNVADRPTRQLVARLLAYEAQQLAWLRELRGAANPTRPPSPLTIEQAGAVLDRYLSIPGVEPK